MSSFLEGRSPAEVEDALGQLHGVQCAVQRKLLHAVAELDSSQRFKVDGAATAAAWLCARLGLSHRTARDWVEVARGLKDLPLIGTAFEEGRLSFDQIRALVKIATPEDEEAFLDKALGSSAAALDAAARRGRDISAAESDEENRRRFVKWRLSEDRRTWRLSARLPEIDGAIVVKALERLVERAPEEPPGDRTPYSSRCADALVELASHELADDADPARALVALHVDAATLREGRGIAELEDGAVMGAETARRVSCDASIETVLDGPDGQPVGIGRRSRKVPPWLLRQLRRRDGACSFPGCTRTRWLHAHHIEHWALGGATDRDNLVLLCWHHHRLCHEGGWGIRGRPQGRLRFVRPDGRELDPGPPSLRPEIAARLPSLVPT